jgi:D-galactarolactone cycloisomerase
VNTSRPADGLTLTIRRIETIPIRVPLGRVYRGSYYSMSHRSTIVTRVHTDEGIVGEAYVGDEDAGLLDIEAIIHGEIEPHLIGQDGAAIERCWQLSRPVTFNILRDQRLGLVAAACVDAALWDAIGKALGVPLWKLWGGYRDRMPIISIGGYYDCDLSVTEEVAALRERGLAGMKFKVGGRDPQTDVRRFLEAREAAGPDFVLAADANQGWTREQAIAFARGVDDAGLYWFEEPCHWHNDRRAMRDVRTMAGVAVCAGQSELSAGGCRELMIEGSIDFCNFDSSWSGGATEWRRVAAMAMSFDVLMAHHEEPHIAMHLLASIPHGTFVECFDADRDPIWWNLVANRPEITDGHVDLPTAPGFGWILDEDFIEQHRVER